MKYNNHEGRDKLACHRALLKELRLICPPVEDKRITAVILSNLGFRFERMLLDKYSKIDIYVVEIDKKVHAQQILESYNNPNLRTTKNQTIHFINDDIGNVKIKEKIDLLWLDYCGHFTENLLFITRKFINNNSLSNLNLVAITTRVGQEGIATQEFQASLYKKLIAKNKPYVIRFHRISLIEEALHRIIFNRLVDTTLDIETRIKLSYSASPKNEGEDKRKAQMNIIGMLTRP